MKSSAMGRILFPRDGDRRPPPDPFERDSGEDQDAAGDLEWMQRLREKDEREEDGEERLQVAEERRARRPDAVDRGEPEDVGEEERADHRVAEAEPDLPTEREVLRRHLRDADERERDPPDREHESADPERRVAAHQGANRDRVAAPGEREPDREQVSAETAREVAPTRGRNEPNASERDRRAEPERVRQLLEPEDDREQRDEDRRRAEQERDRGRLRELECVHEAQLVEEERERRDEHEREVSARDAKGALAAVREDPEQRGGG